MAMSEAPHPVRISRPVMLGFYLSGLLSGLVLLLASIVCFAFQEPDLVTCGQWMLGAGALVMFLTSTAVLFILIHKMWKSIQFDQPRYTPGKAVGLCFIPGFNLYWIFPATIGWAKDYNQLLERRRLKLKRMPMELACIVPIGTALSLIPFLGQVLWLVFLFVLYPLFISAVSARANALADQIQIGFPKLPPQLPVRQKPSPPPLPTRPPE